MGYTLLDHATDALVDVYADDMDAALQDAAYAAIDIMLDRKRVSMTKTRSIHVTSHSMHEMLYDWLEEIIYQTITDGFAISSLKATYQHKTGSRYIASGILCGEPLDVQRHHFAVEIKAPTYHEMSIRQDNGVAMRFLMDL